MEKRALTHAPPNAPEVVTDQTAEDIRVRFLISLGSENTRNAYANDLADWGRWLAKHDVDPLQASRAHVDAYARQLEQDGKGPATISRRLAALNGYYRYAVDEEKIGRNPVERVRRPNVSGDSPTHSLDRAERERFMQAARSEKVSLRDRALVTLLGVSALRVSEALGANVDDLGTEDEHCTLRVLGKGGKHATVTVNRIVCEALEAYLAERGHPESGPLFVTATGRRLDRFAAFRIVARIARLAGITKRISPHSLRHSAITGAFKAGRELTDVQDFARHSDARTTRRYDHRGKLGRSARVQAAVAAEWGLV